ncbi:predicted protein [Arabidopsis lyrata subsp. lyrata]|uniref:Predicted protein n=1 Tax=Arabidopsis lyrata subsp. lyrata TaxID=81972 RepID=D7MNC4_ARALL|nr:predicted protein [Arabidopsis lyrata subsp. lyrata]
MQQEELDNDDLLEDNLQEEDAQVSGEHTVSEQIQPVSRRKQPLSPSSLSLNSKAAPSPTRRPAKERIEYPKASGSKASHRRRRAEAKSQTNKGPTELLGMASKKMNILNAGSPKKRAEAKSQTARSRNGKPSSSLPRSGVFPSAINKKSKSRSGLVGSQNPPSKKI